MVLLLTSCVSTKKYQSLSSRYDERSRQAVSDSARFEEIIAQVIRARDSLAGRYTLLEDKYLQLKNDSLTLAQNYRRNKGLLDDLFEKYDQLDKSYRQLAGNLSSETVNLTQNISQKEKELLVLEQKLLAQQAKNDKLTMELQEREVRMLAFENSIRKMDKSAADLKTRLEKSLAGNKDSTLKIEARAGKVYVSFPETLLYTGTSTLSAKGGELLKKIAASLKSHPDLTVGVATILPPVPGDMSVAANAATPRMYEIVKFLSKEGVTSSRIVVSIKQAASSEGGNKKARKDAVIPGIEVVLEPKLDSILQSLQSN